MSGTGDYISREAAISGLDKLEKTSYHNSVLWPDHVEECREALRSIPAADVRPVVKARWVYTDMSRLVCSNCGNPVAFALKDDGWHHGDFCPNCGADMREER